MGVNNATNNHETNNHKDDTMPTMTTNYLYTTNLDPSPVCPKGETPEYTWRQILGLLDDLGINSDVRLLPDGRVVSAAWNALSGTEPTVYAERDDEATSRLNAWEIANGYRPTTT